MQILLPLRIGPSGQIGKSPTHCTACFDVFKQLIEALSVIVQPASNVLNRVARINSVLLTIVLCRSDLVEQIRTLIASRDARRQHDSPSHRYKRDTDHAWNTAGLSESDRPSKSPRHPIAARGHRRSHQRPKLCVLYQFYNMFTHIVETVSALPLMFRHGGFCCSK